jgi:hypothetical protein
MAKEHQDRLTNLHPNQRNISPEAAQAPQAAKSVTTRAIRSRLLDEALEYDRLADQAPRTWRKRLSRPVWAEDPLQ